MRKARENWPALVLTLLAWGGLLAAVGIVVAPTLEKLELLGGHDWDYMTTHRYLVRKSLREFGQFPFWDPYNCGGHPSWAGVESGTTLISPWFPVYLWMPIPIALRVEIIGAALISAIGTWVCAGRFTKSVGLRLFVCAIFVVNGRWALQAAAGHAWHLYYAWTPWALYFFDRASGRDEPKGSPFPLGSLAFGGVTVAMMVMNGAIYPLPQTVFTLGLYSILLGITHKTIVPIVRCMLLGLIGFGLSASKLLPILDSLSRFPRLTDSPETLDFNGFITLLTARNQDFGARPAPVSHWGWHEWGMYVGWVPVVLLVFAAFRARGRVETALKWTGVALLVLGFGSFFEYAPWPLLRKLPIFSSQHVPSRWLYPTVLVFGLLFAYACDRWLRRFRRGRILIELALLALALYVSFDVASVAMRPMKSAFWMSAPPTNKQAEFVQHDRVPRELHYFRDDWAPPAFPAMKAGVGVIECVTYPGLNIFSKLPDGRILGLGARGRENPKYRGEVYTESNVGTARFVEWSPNRLTVAVEGASVGDHVIVNQNWDPSWRADGEPAIRFEDKIAAPIRSPNQVVHFVYRSRFFFPGLLVTFLTLVTLAGVSRRGRALISRLFARIRPRRRAPLPPETPEIHRQDAEERQGAPKEGI